MGYRYDGELEQPMARLLIKELGSKTPKVEGDRWAVLVRPIG
jgi:hypothetical protein